MRAFFSLCLAAAILALTPLSANAIQVIVTNKYNTSKDHPNSYPYVSARGNNNVTSKQGYKIPPGKSIIVLSNSKATNVQGISVTMGSGEFFFPMNIRGSKVRLDLVKRKGEVFLYSPQLKKTYSYVR